MCRACSESLDRASSLSCRPVGQYHAAVPGCKKKKVRYDDKSNFIQSAREKAHVSGAQTRHTRARAQPHTCIHTWTVWQLTRKSRQRPVAYLLGKWSDVSNDSKQGLEQRLTRTPTARAVGMMAEIGMLREQQLGDSMPVTGTRVR